MTKSMERRLGRLEAGNDDEPCVITDNSGAIAFQGTNAELQELMREVNRRGRDRRLSKVVMK